MSFAERFKTWRESVGFSQGEFAARLGVSQQTVSDWESGKARPRVGRLRDIARLLEVSEPELVRAFTESSAPPGTDDAELQELAARIRRLPPSARTAVESLVDELLRRRRR